MTAADLESLHAQHAQRIEQIHTQWCAESMETVGTIAGLQGQIAALLSERRTARHAIADLVQLAAGEYNAEVSAILARPGIGVMCPTCEGTGTYLDEDMRGDPGASLGYTTRSVVVECDCIDGRVAR